MITKIKEFFYKKKKTKDAIERKKNEG